MKFLIAFGIICAVVAILMLDEYLRDMHGKDKK